MVQKIIKNHLTVGHNMSWQKWYTFFFAVRGCTQIISAAKGVGTPGLKEETREPKWVQNLVFGNLLVLEGNPEEQPCQPKENPVLPDSFTQIYILFLIGFRIGPPIWNRMDNISSYILLGWEHMSLTGGGWLLSPLNLTPKGQGWPHWPERLTATTDQDWQSSWIVAFVFSFIFITMWTTMCLIIKLC